MAVREEVALLQAFSQLIASCAPPAAPLLSAAPPLPAVIAPVATVVTIPAPPRALRKRAGDRNVHEVPSPHTTKCARSPRVKVVGVGTGAPVRNENRCALCERSLDFTSNEVDPLVGWNAGTLSLFGTSARCVHKACALWCPKVTKFPRPWTVHTCGAGGESRGRCKSGFGNPSRATAGRLRCNKVS